MKSELEDFISNNREAFDTRVPDAKVLERLQQKLQQQAFTPVETKKEKAIVIPMKMAKWAAAACVVLIAGAIFWTTQKETPAAKTEIAVIDTPAVVPGKTTTAETTAAVAVPGEKQMPVQLASKKSNELAIEEENNIRKNMLFAKLNNMESPSQRLTAASQLYQLKDGDTEIVDALVKTMNNDPSTNVRLAALDGLSRFYREAYVKKKLVASLGKQTDPMVQMQLIELLTKMKERSILKQLDKIVNDGNTMQAVKDQAYTSIFTLRS